ncbi:NADPH-dependent FMN reductase [Saccharomonospora piscinae]|uniref:NADPH-dependent FMN reductase n=1 Tax=Saccharomonospora piscinae TaxID=687388 RepID=UPI00046505E8|nr:NAD(P)H-dependent oxidoreductase [Saccharomonospora piscinae]
MTTTASTTASTQQTTASTTRLRLAVIIGSVRTDRFGTVPAEWFAGRASAHGDYDVDVIDLADYDLPVSMDENDDVAALGARLAEADAFVVATPEYNHSFPAGLKNAIDHFHAEWQAKPVALLSYGGMSGGLRAVEHLRLVFAELHAVTMRNSLSFHNVWGLFDDAGAPKDESTATAAKQLLDQLRWWAVALRDARHAHPYGA